MSAGEPDGAGYTPGSMLVHNLTRVGCIEVLQRSDLGRLACAAEDQPYVVPIHFSFDAVQECLFAMSTVGQKIEWMRRNPKVCVEVEDVVDKDHWTTVLAFGRYQELPDRPAYAAALQTAQELFSGRGQWWLPAVAKTGQGEHHEIVVYRIQIDRLTGRRAARDRSRETLGGLAVG